MNKKFRIAEDFLKEAWEELRKYEQEGKETSLRQACEKGWAAVTQALKVINPKIKVHRDFGDTALKLAKEYNMEEILHGESCGEALHRTGFYEGQMSKGVVEANLKCVENFLKLINKILNSKKLENEF
jgi:hypothetical protein